MTDATTHDDAPDGSGAPARVMGDVRITGRVGEGTLSEVFRGVQQPLGRVVAVKVLRASIAPASQLGKRFSREAALLSRLVHQNLPQVFSIGVHGDRPYIVMEYVEGTTLRALLDQAPNKTIPADVATAIAVKIARALEFLHLHSVVHRDVKPANVIVAHTGEVKLIDLGIARDLSEEDDRLGTVGTSAYMSPEQILGDRLDFRADLFSFGILYYEMLTGTRPFEEDAARSVMQKIRLDRYRPARDRNKHTPRVLELVLARCLEKNPSHRYTSTGALCDDLGNFLAQLEIHSHEARVVEYLVDRDLVPELQARKALGPAGSAWSTKGVSSQRLWLTILVQVICSMGLIATMVMAERARSRGYMLEGSALRGPQPDGTPNTGSLRVVAHPWATVQIDGLPIDSTPTARAFRLAPGAHLVRFSHPLFEPEARTVQIEQGVTVWLEVDLVRPRKEAR